MPGRSPIIFTSDYKERDEPRNATKLLWASVEKIELAPYGETSEYHHSQTDDHTTMLDKIPAMVHPGANLIMNLMGEDID